MVETRPGIAQTILVQYSPSLLIIVWLPPLVVAHQCFPCTSVTRIDINNYYRLMSAASMNKVNGLFEDNRIYLHVYGTQNIS